MEGFEETQGVAYGNGDGVAYQDGYGQQHQSESRRFVFDKQIIKRSSSRNLEGFEDTQGATEKDGVAYQDGLDKGRRKNGRKLQGRMPQRWEPQG